MNFQRILAYSAALDAHNERPWFHENHKWYEDAKADFAALLDALRFPVAREAPAIARDILTMEAKDWCYRIPRDMRMHREGPPYNPAFRAYISANRRSWQPMGYYISIFPGASVFGTGLWCWESAQRGRARDYIAAHYQELEELLAACPIPLSGQSLTRMPKGYPEGHPAAKLLRMQEWALLAPLTDGELLDFAPFAAKIEALVEQMEPLRLFFMRAARGEGPDDPWGGQAPRVE